MTLLIIITSHPPLKVRPVDIEHWKLNSMKLQMIKWKQGPRKSRILVKHKLSPQLGTMLSRTTYSHLSNIFETHMISYLGINN